MIILDSGSRRKFDTGAERDITEDKGRCDLMPLDVVAWMLRDVEDNADPVLDCIDRFTRTGNLLFLYDALDKFSLKWGVDNCTMLLEVAKHYSEGCKKYGEDNWKKGIPLKSYIDSGTRHYLKWLRGDQDEPHHKAFVWNMMSAIWTCKYKPELNDYSKKEASE
jgi:hypothetical protein